MINSSARKIFDLVLNKTKLIAKNVSGGKIYPFQKFDNTFAPADPENSAGGDEHHQI